MFPDMRALDFFSEVNRRACEVERYQGRVSLMEHRRGVKAQGYDPATSGSRPDVNGTAASIALMDFEERKRREVDEHYRWIEAASKACFGADERGGGGLCALLGSTVAEAVYLHYAENMTWAATARAVGLSESQAERKAEAGVSACDLIGYSGLIAPYKKPAPWDGVEAAPVVAC